MTNYEKLDDLILSAIANFGRPSTLGRLQSGDVWVECERLADANEAKGLPRSRYHAGKASRILGRRLQALRCAGKIRFGYKRGDQPPGWMRVEG